MKKYTIREIQNQMFGTLRHTTDDTGVIWFSAVDAYKKLGLNNQVLKRLDADDKMPNMFPVKNNSKQSTGVTEAGLYQLIMASKKPEANAFKRWITHEVLPSIRKTGGYVLGQEELPPDERTVLENYIRDLTEQVQKANLGKAKLSDHLRTADERNEMLAGWFREEIRARRTLEEECKALRERLGENSSERAGNSSAEIPVAIIPAFDPDPLVIGRDGLVIRLSELLGVDLT